MQIEREKISFKIGERIHDFRVSKSLSQETLALASDIHPAYLGRIERGEKCPSIDTLYKISRGLKIPLTKLVDISEEVKPTHAEAMHRITAVLNTMTESEAVDLAAIVEKLSEFKTNT